MDLAFRTCQPIKADSALIVGGYSLLNACIWNDARCSLRANSAFSFAQAFDISSRRSLTGNAILTKLVTLERMAALAAIYRHAGRRLVLTNGCFDLLHIGHVASLKECSQRGDILVVAVNSDASIRRLKGPTRPVFTQEIRAAQLAALRWVDHVLIFDELTPHELLCRIRPDILVKGGTYCRAEIVGAEIVESYGGRVCLTTMIPAVSTTNILASFREGRAVRVAHDLVAINTNVPWIVGSPQ